MTTLSSSATHHKSFKYRLYPNQEQERILYWTLARCRELYNAALAERKEAYRMVGKTVTYYEQKKDLPIIKAELREEYQYIYSQVLCDILLRLERAFQHFYRRVKLGQAPGYPRFQGRSRYTSFTYPQKGFSLTLDNHLCLTKIGDIKIVLHRPLQGKAKTCTIKNEGDHWYVIFSCEVEASPKLPYTDETVGIDLGLLHFATLSTGDTIENPRHFRKGEKKLARLQQAVSRKKRNSHRRKKVMKQVAKAHRKIRNQRHDFLHKQSRQLVATYDTLVFEDLQTSDLVRRPKPKQDEVTGAYLPNGANAKSGLNKSITDAGWSQFIAYCMYKAAWASTSVLFVDPKYTSQTCSGCGSVRKKELSERWHSCECGTELDRDHNAAINILRLGSSQREQSRKSPVKGTSHELREAIGEKG